MPGYHFNTRQNIGGREVIDMTEAKTVMENFMKKLAADGYKKENQPNHGPQLNMDFIDDQLKSYSRMLKSGILDAATGK